MTNATNLLERESELAEFVDGMAAARAGTGRLILVEGPAGIGKTELLAAAWSLADAAGLVVTRARGSELEAGFAFGVVRQLFEPLLRTRPRPEQNSVLRGSASFAAGLLGAADQRSTPAEVRLPEALHSLFWLTLNLADRGPLAVLIDDAHWADRASLRFLSYLAGRIDGVSAVVVVTARAAETPSADEVLQRVRRERNAKLMQLKPLSVAAVAELIQRELHHEVATAFARASREATGGNPFYLTELVRALRADEVKPTAAMAPRVARQGPAGVARSVLTRIAGLSPAAGKVVRALALLGGESGVRELTQLSLLDKDSVVEAVDDLAGAEIVVGAEPVVFVHPIVRASIYADIPAGERAHSHLRAARVLASSSASTERVAAHLLSTSPAGNKWTVGVLCEAARLALSRGAPESAVSYLTRALAEGPAARDRGKLVALLGLSQYLAYQPEASAHLVEAMEAATTPRDRGELALQAARAMIMVDPDRSETAIQLLDRAIDDLAAPGSQLSMRLEAHVLASAGLKLSTRSLQRHRLSNLYSRPLGDEAPDRLLLANLASWTLVEGRNPGGFDSLARHARTASFPAEAACQVAERALAGGPLLREEGSDSQLFYLAIRTLCLGEWLDRAEHWLEQSLEDARERGSVLGYALTEASLAQVDYRRGELTRAEAHARAAAEISAHDAVAVLVDILIEQGRLVEADRELAQLRIAPDGDHLLLQPIRASRGRLLLASGRAQEAAREFQACADWLHAWGADNPAHIPWRANLALALIHLDRRERAHELAKEEVTIARSLGQARALGTALRVLGLTERGDDGIEILQESVAVLEQSASRLELARVLTDYGAAMRRSGRRAEARTPLRRGLALAHECGATMIREHAYEEILATGARPRRPAISGRDALTATEIRVAEMAAQGHSTPEIAQALFVTPKTIETHLSHTYQKLDIHKRAELAQALATG